MILHTVSRGPPDGRPLVMLHGLFGRAANFGAVQARLSARCRVIAIDLRGHGASPHAAPLDYQSMAADLGETLRSLEAVPCDLLGHSMGGKVAMTVALQSPEMVARLIVADIAPVAYGTPFRAFVAAMRALDLSAPLSRAAADAALSVPIPDPAVRGFLLQNFRPGAAPGWTFDLDGIAASLPMIGDWPDSQTTYTGPTLFLAGSRSTYIDQAGWARARALFPAARLVTLAGVGHWLHAEDPEGFLGAVAGFLS